MVVSSVAEMIADIAIRTSSSPDSNSAGSHSIRMIRILRSARLIRVLRIVRIVRFVRSLRTLVFSIIGTLRTLGWAMLLLLLIIYFFAVLFTQGMADHNASGPTDVAASECSLSTDTKFWADLPRSMLTLFGTITNGIDWTDALAPLSDVSGVWVIVFVMYIYFASFAVLNVITAVFCQSAIEGAQQDAELAIQEQMKNKSRYLGMVKELFDKIDNDGSGLVTIKELERHMNDANIRAFFEAVELDPADAWTLFKLLDSTGSNTISSDDFVMGCMRLKGVAKSIDLATLSYEGKVLRNNLAGWMNHMEEGMFLVQESLGRLVHVIGLDDRVSYGESENGRRTTARFSHQRVTTNGSHEQRNFEVGERNQQGGRSNSGTTQEPEEAASLQDSSPRQVNGRNRLGSYPMVDDLSLR